MEQTLEISKQFQVLLEAICSGLLSLPQEPITTHSLSEIKIKFAAQKLWNAAGLLKWSRIVFS